MKWKEHKDSWSDKYGIVTTAAETGTTGVGLVTNRKVGETVNYSAQFSDRVVLIRIDTKLNAHTDNSGMHADVASRR